MLKVNMRNNTKVSYADISSGIDSMGYAANNSYLYVNYPNHKLKGNDVLIFDRTDGNDIAFNYSFRPVIINENGFLSSIPKITYFNVSKIDNVQIRRSPEREQERALIFYLENGYSHYNVKNRDSVTIKEYITDGINVTTDRIRRRCVGDYILYNSYFRFTASDVIDDKYIITGECDNIKDVVLNFINDNDEVISLHNVIVPSDSIGKDRTDILIWFYDDSVISIAEMLIENNPIVFYCNDTRFFNFNEDSVTLKIDEGAVLYREMNGISINIPITETYSVGIDDEINNGDYYAKQTIKNSIPKILDYEKRQFSPVYIFDGSVVVDGDNVYVDDNSIKPVREIDFNLHFRKRSNTEEWESEDDDLWNNYEFVDAATNALRPVDENLSSDNSDLIGKIGFTDDDVYYTKECLKKSFIRLSFYDSPDRRTQSLLFYSTIFVDSKKLLSKFYKNVNNGVKDNIVLNEQIKSVGVDDLLRLDMSFKCFDKYSLDGSSEGFYLYLFSGISKGALCMPIYMKAEFNHAKFGKKIPFVMPVDKDNNIIEPTDKNFPTSYTVIDEYGQMSADMNRLFSDMYVKLLVKYDYISNRYVWMLPREIPDCNGKIKFNLFEPRINGVISNGSITVDKDYHNFRGHVINAKTNSFDSRMKTVTVYLMPPYVSSINSPSAIKYTTSEKYNGLLDIHKTKQDTIKWVVLESSYYYSGEGTVTDKSVNEIFDFNIPLAMKKFADVTVTLKFKFSDQIFALIEDSTYATISIMLDGTIESTRIPVNNKVDSLKWTFYIVSASTHTLGVNLKVYNADMSEYLKTLVLVDKDGLGVDGNSFVVRDNENRDIEINAEFYNNSMDEKALTTLEYYLMDLNWSNKFKQDGALIGVSVNDEIIEEFNSPFVTTTQTTPPVDKYFISGVTVLNRYEPFTLGVAYTNDAVANGNVELTDVKISENNLKDWFNTDANVLNDLTTKTSKDAIGYYISENYTASTVDDGIYYFKFQLWDGSTLISKEIPISIRYTEAAEPKILSWPQQNIYTAYTPDCNYRIEDPDSVYSIFTGQATNEKTGESNMVIINVDLQRSSSGSGSGSGSGGSTSDRQVSVVLNYELDFEGNDTVLNEMLGKTLYIKFVYNSIEIDGLSVEHVFSNSIEIDDKTINEGGTLPPVDGTDIKEEIINVPEGINEIAFGLKSAEWVISKDMTMTPMSGVELSAVNLGTMDVNGQVNSNTPFEIGTLKIKFIGK